MPGTQLRIRKSAWSRLLALTALLACFSFGVLHAQDEPVAENGVTTLDAEQEGTRDQQENPEGPQAAREEAALNEDPEAQRRSQIEDSPILRSLWPDFEFYGSVRLHAINNFNEQDELTEFNLGDGASRIGLRGELQISEKWWLFGRAEAGFDVLDTFTPKAGEEGADYSGLNKRLLVGGFDSKNASATFGKNWSAYYKIAGMADRFSIFGGSGVGVYNANTDGGATGTGRADEVFQARIYTNSLKALSIKPFNLNVQYQDKQPIPHVSGKHYGSAYGASAWLESLGDRGIGLAYQRSKIDFEDPLIKAAGIDGDALAGAMAFRMYGEKWYAALVVAQLENVMTTDQLKYINGRGGELYIQWQVKDKWWVIGGGNWFTPFEEDPDAGSYEVNYAVLGLRYTFDSFNRMLYAEYRLDSGILWNGTPRKNELTIGIRWDFGHQ